MSLPSLRWLQRLRPEDPRRIEAFRKMLEGLSWDKTHAQNSLNTLFNAVDDLAEAEAQLFGDEDGIFASLRAAS